MGRRLLIALASAAAIHAAAAGAAWAGGTITTLPDPVNPIEHRVAGPAFAGEAVAYAVPVGRAYSVRIQQPGGTTTSQLVPAKGAGPLGEWESVADRLAASPQVVALSHTYVTCGDESGCKYQEYEPIESTVFAGALGGPLDFRGCNDSTYPSGIDASGGVIAYLDACADGAVVHDPTSPESSSRVFPAVLYGDGDVRIAGRYLAVDTRPDPREAPRLLITVYDWQTGDVVYKIAGDYGLDSFDIQDDGTLAFHVQSWTNGDDSDVYWASPEDPIPHLVAHRRNAVLEDVRIADGKIAVGGFRAYVVFALDGTKLASTPNRDSPGEFDFDGKRLAYTDQPCMVSAVVTWDLSGAAPTMPAGSCPAARAAGSEGAVDLKRRRVALPLRCPANPQLGCAGAWEADLDSRPPAHTKYEYPALLPGEKRTVTLRLSRRTACRLARTPATRATIDLRNNYARRPHAERGKARFKLRTTGRARGCS